MVISILRIVTVQLFLIMGLCPLSVTGQSPYNLVPNYSFETTQTCSPNGMPNIFPWTSASTSSQNNVDYSNACFQNTCCSVPVNIFGTGYQYANTGGAYLIAYFMYENNIRRGYPQVKLKDSLKPNQCYYVEFFVNLVNASEFSINNVGMLLSKYKPSQGIYSYPLLDTPQIISYGNPVLPVDTVNWTKINGIYIAIGGENYITIGNFKDDAHTDTIHTNFPGAFKKGEYYIDDVSVIPISIDSFYLKADAGLDTTITIGDSVFIGTLLGGTITTTWYNSSGSVVATNVPGLYVSPTQNTYYVLEQSMCTYTSRDTVYVSIQSLPLKLLTFTAKWLSSSPSTEEPVLQWTTAQELNTSHFEIERSFNGREFSKIGIVKANTTTQLNTYKFSDAVAPNSPLWGAGGLFYRLKMVDKDGQFTYSPIRQLSINQSSLNIAVYPNPAKDVVNIAGSNMVQLTLTDQTGRNLFTRQCANSSLETIPVKRFGRGVYVLRVMDAKGNNHIAKVVVE